MVKNNLTVRVDKELLTNFKKFATMNHSTMTNLIEAYLRQIPDQKIGDYTQIVRQISGILSQEVTTDEYKKHLEEKYSQ
jgi:hypothetical protein